MHMPPMWYQNGHLLRHGTTCEEPASYVSIQIAIHTVQWGGVEYGDYFLNIFHVNYNTYLLIFAKVS